MLGRKFWGIAALVLVATLAPMSVEARGGGGGGHAGGYAIGTSTGVHGVGSFNAGAAAGVHHGGYAIGTESMGQYAGSHVPGTGGRGYWRNGYGGYGGYGGGWWGLTGAGQAGWGGDNTTDTGDAYYNSPAPTSLPAASADDDTDVRLKQTGNIPDHVGGASMSFQTDFPQSTSPTFSNYDRDFNEIVSGGTPVPAYSNVSGSFLPPSISRKYPQLKTLASNNGSSTVSFNSGNAGGFTAQVQAKLQSVQALMDQYKASGKLGTFDITDLQSRLDGIKSRFQTSQKSPSEGEMQQGSILNDLSSLEYDIRRHGN